MQELHCLIPTAAMTVPRATTETKTMTSLCESDFFAWANEQAFLLRAGKLSRAEIENIAEEIENMGQKREARAGQQADHPAAALAQMAVPAKPAWKQLELHDQGPARDVGRHLADNPSLPALLGDSYVSSVLLAAGETGLPEACFRPLASGHISRLPILILAGPTELAPLS
jgi:hypothetical protein